MSLGLNEKEFPPEEPRRSWVLWVVVGVFILLLAVAAFWKAQHNKAQQELTVKAYAAQRAALGDLDREITELEKNIEKLKDQPREKSDIGTLEYKRDLRRMSYKKQCEKYAGLWPTDEPRPTHPCP